MEEKDQLVKRLLLPEPHYDSSFFKKIYIFIGFREEGRERLMKRDYH